MCILYLSVYVHIVCTCVCVFVYIHTYTHIYIHRHIHTVTIHTCNTNYVTTLLLTIIMNLFLFQVDDFPPVVTEDTAPRGTSPTSLRSHSKEVKVVRVNEKYGASRVRKN